MITSTNHTKSPTVKNTNKQTNNPSPSPSHRIDKDDLVTNGGAVRDALRARGVGVQERVLLIFPTCREFVYAMFGCMLARVVAVPVFPPTAGGKSLASIKTDVDRVSYVCGDCDAAGILTLGSIARILMPLGWTPGVARAYGRVISVHHRQGGGGGGMPSFPQASLPVPSDIAILQYSSGSTGEPKGVIVTHQMLFHHLSQVIFPVLVSASGIDAHVQDTALSWLAPWHDMGLFAFIFMPSASAKWSVLLMSPLTFLKNPLSWLTALHRYRASVTGAPNFAFEVCQSRTVVGSDNLPGGAAALDLSCVRWCVTGAEPVRHETLKGFVEKFGPFGFRSSAITPAYGLAEATLMVSIAKEPRPLWVDSAQLQAGIVSLSSAAAAKGTSSCFVSCGAPVQEVAIEQDGGDGDGDLVAISASTTLLRIGQIWVRGGSVCSGYWGRPPSQRRGGWMATGDAGFAYQGELYICGRLKDMLIVRGRKLWPQDLERTVELGVAMIRKGCVAATSYENGVDTTVAVIAEHRHFASLSPMQVRECASEIAMLITKEHGVRPLVEVVAPRTLGKTSSGKMMRWRAKTWLETTLKQRKDTQGVAQQMEHSFPRMWRLFMLCCHFFLTLHSLCFRVPPVPILLAPPKPVSVVVANAVPLAVAESTTHFISSSHAADEYESALVAGLVDYLKLEDPQQIDKDAPLSSYLDSRDMLALSKQLPFPFNPVLLFDFPSVRALSAYLANPVAVARPLLLGSSDDVDASAPTELSVIGIGLRLPGGIRTCHSLWNDVLLPGRDMVTQGSRGGMTHPAGWLTDVAAFDARHFGLSIEAASAMDPSQRLILECVADAIQDGNFFGSHLGASVRAHTAVSMGTCASGYSHLMRAHGIASTSGLAPCMVANRVSAHWGFEGPSLSLDTACSSSLMAVHHASEWLFQGRQALHAVAGGVNVLLVRQVSDALQREGFLSASSGRCRAYSQDADGYVRAEGAAVVLMTAKQELWGDQSYAVIRGSFCNHNGHGMSLVAPKASAQQHVIEGALKAAGITAKDVAFIEGHGSATQLGDAIELEALRRVFEQRTTTPLYVGSAKSNFGHLEAAAGILGFVKAMLCLHERMLVPSLHFSPDCANAAVVSPLCVPCAPTQWSDNGEVRFVGGVSSFGFGGANVHVVVAEPRVRRSSGLLPREPIEWNPVRCWLDWRHVEAARSSLSQYCLDATALSGLKGHCLHVFREVLFKVGEGQQQVLPLYRKGLIQSMQSWCDRNAAGAAELCDLRQYPEWSAEIAMLESTRPRLLDVLSGQCSPLEVLFPNGDASNAERVFSVSPMSLGCNEAVATAICSLFESSQRRRRRSFSILEVGAGTGGTTAHVLKRLAELCNRDDDGDDDDVDGSYSLTYWISDVSPVFVAAARSKFETLYPFTRYCVLDIEDGAACYRQPNVDVLLAANVVHATRDVTRTISHLSAMVQQGLILLEITRPHPWLDLTFGLTEQWWGFGEDPLRQGGHTPVLTGSQWERILGGAGFSCVASLEQQGGAQSIIMATCPSGNGAGDGGGGGRTSIASSTTALVGGGAVLNERLAALVDKSKGEDVQVVEQLISAALCSALGIESIDPSENLLSLGLDSMMVLTLRSALGTRFPGVSIELSSLTTAPSVGGIAKAVVAGFLARRDRATVSPVQALQPRTSPSQSRAFILSLGTANPRFKMEQTQLARDAALFYALQPPDVLERLQRIYSRSEIATRYSVLPDWSHPDVDAVMWNGWRDRPCSRPVGIGLRNAVYSQEAPKLAIAAAQKALASWGGDKRAITHVVSVSCTGTLVPGIEFRVMEALGLERTVERLGVNFMGCFGGLAGLRCARSLAESCPGARVLLVCTELCTVHFEGGTSEPLTGESIVASAIFADGAAAAIVGCDPDNAEAPPLFEMLAQRCQGIDDSVKSMAWELGDTGWRVGLAPDIPMRLAEVAEPFVNALLGGGPREDVVFALHPGGSSILKGFEAILQLEPSWQTAASWDVLRDYGNMSSCTILFVLERALQTAIRRRGAGGGRSNHTLAMAFGPGLSVEGMLLRNCLSFLN